MTGYSGPIRGVCEGIFDGPHATPKESEEGPIFLGIGNVTRDGRLDLSEIRHVSEQEFPSWTRRVTPQRDDVVFSYEATLHRYARIPENFRGCLGRRMALVRVDRTKVDPRFLLYYFLSPQWRRVIEGNVISGATVDRIPIKRFPSFPVSIPRLEQQKEISDILDAYDSLIENNRRRIRLLEQASRLIYQEWFVRFRFPGHEHTRISNGAPEGWQIRALGDILTLKRGYDLPESKRLEGEIPVVSSSGITGYHNEMRVRAPGVVTGRYGALGEVFFVQSDFWPLNTALYVTDFKGLPPEYAAHLLSNLLSGVQSDKAAVPGLDRNVLHKMAVLVPPKPLRDQFSSFALLAYRQMLSLENSCTKLRAARDLLLPRLMIGEVEV